MEKLMVQLVALSGVFGLGMSFALLGSISVKLMPRLNIDQAKFGSLVSVFMFCCLVASLVVGAVMDSVGYQKLAAFGLIAMALCIFLLARAKSYGSAVFAFLLLGFAAMSLNTVGNVLGPDVFFEGKNPAAASNLLNVFFGLGLFLTPFILSFLFQKVSYEAAVSTLGVIILVPLAFAFLAKYPEAKGFSVTAAFDLLKEPATIVAALVLFCYIALESSFCNWLAPFGKEVISKAEPAAEASAVDARAQRLLSVFAIAMMIGRFAASQVPALTAMGSYVIAIAAAVVTLVILGMMGAKSAGAAYTMAALAGLSFAPCFPTTVGVTFDKFGGGSGSLFGIIFAVGLLGAVIIPKAIGNLAKGTSVQKALKLLLPACVLLIVLALGLHFVKGPAAKAATTQPAKAAKVAPSVEPAKVTPVQPANP